ncbi:hypothetical protein NQ318_004125 [Aromia moschata]|uniref:HTH psq-type domain-containing protein n=1 Tax=Aromia moschata TaxID=1265417 RepID=A0AAV8YLN4_9CUCU|nr:hypothetical protein NQ318_004125 [Aromia moschata]
MTIRKAFTIAEKAAIVWRLEAGESNVSIAKEFGVAHSTISTIWKHRDKIQSVFENSSISVKNIRSCNQSRGDRVLFEWFKIQISRNIPISGPIMHVKDNFVRQLKLQDFKCWMDSTISKKT